MSNKHVHPVFSGILDAFSRTADGLGYSEADLKAFAAGRAMLAVLEEVSDELDNRSDVVDGTDGQPRANWAMSLKRDVDDAIEAAKSAGFASGA